MNIPFFMKIRRYRWYLLGRLEIKKHIKYTKGKLKVTLGAGLTNYDEWISTDLPHFDILKKEDWNYFFKENSIDNLLIEHVLEHFTREDVVLFLKLSFHYLRIGGCIRIAVPDGYHPDPNYIKMISPPADDHKYVWNVDALKQVLNNNGFDTDTLEYYSKEGTFFGKDFSTENGTILRSKTRNQSSENAHYSSLIMDAYKQNQ